MVNNLIYVKFLNPGETITAEKKCYKIDKSEGQGREEERLGSDIDNK